ncbi:MAG: lipopolysaccharide kinase InaA family protein [Opitutales bacterium]
MPIQPDTQDQPDGNISDGRSKRLVSLFWPGRLDREFMREAVRGINPFQYRLSGRSRAEGGHTVGADFAGVGVAVPEDERGVRATMDALQKLGVLRVRLDYTYEHESRAVLVEGLLEQLNAQGVKILLHLVAPVAEAASMPDEYALSRWREFVATALTRFAPRIEAVEFGASINRYRWSGYSLAGFLEAWKIGHALTVEHGLVLAGPNVTDFEPQYNAGLLGLFRRRDCLPDIQSNNLFSERTIEPEAFDHKMAGHWSKNALAFNLIKKSHLLASIGERFGVLRHWSTCAFWTLPRIERILKNPEAKQADYLTRYFVLCAASGRFERIYWGPLVSCREGLMDPGNDSPSSSPEGVDVVACYRALPGSPEEWRPRPAFYAMRGLAERIPGAKYLGPAADRPGLQIHAFEKNGHVLHVAWTRNGGLAETKSCYPQDQLNSMERAFAQSGEPLDEPPRTLTEAPVYFEWPKGRSPGVCYDADVWSGTIIARPEQGADYFTFQTAEWRGVIRAADLAEAEKLARECHPGRIGEAPMRSSLRRARNAIWTIADPVRGGGLVVKQPLRIAWHKRFLDRNKPSKGLRSWNGACELLRRGIPTPEPVAIFEYKDKRRFLSNWYVCRHFETKHSVRSFFIRYAAGEEKAEGLDFPEFCEALAPFIRNLHLRGVWFRDLSGGNVLARVREDGALEFSLIDTARARFSNRRFSMRRRIADLKRLTHKLDPQRQREFMNVYLQAEGRRFGVAQRLDFALYALKARLKRIKRSLRKRIFS